MQEFCYVTGIIWLTLVKVTVCYQFIYRFSSFKTVLSVGIVFNNKFLCTVLRNFFQSNMILLWHVK